MPKHGIIVNTMVEQSEEIFQGLRKLCDLKISEEIKNVIYMEKTEYNIQLRIQSKSVFFICFDLFLNQYTVYMTLICT